MGKLWGQQTNINIISMIFLKYQPFSFVSGGVSCGLLIMLNTFLLLRSFRRS